MKTNDFLNCMPGGSLLSKDVLIEKLKKAPPQLGDLVVFLENRCGVQLQLADYQYLRAGINRFLFIYDDMKQDYSALRELMSELDCILISAR
ncbi:hypothetical protein ACQK5W_02330 [Pantoea sp. FN060301]|uniref:hypothetical protein n=1 Tax=Pantoea sp. FN060301 TaxID=3420380 RepID=UPI003D17FEE2